MQKSNSNTKLYELIAEKRMLSILGKEAALKKIPIIDLETGRFLELVCILSKPKNILEIGCGSGFSSYFLVKNLKDGRYTGIDLNRDRIKKAGDFIGRMFPEKNAGFLNGNALEIVPVLNGGFDFVFIDAAKFEYPQYIKKLDGKLKTGALIIADNIFYGNKVFNNKIDRHDYNSVNGIKQYIEYLESSSGFINHFFDIGDGLLVTEFTG